MTRDELAALKSINGGDSAFAELCEALEQAWNENEEQARLLGMSGSREAKLLAENAELKKLLADSVDHAEHDAAAFRINQLEAENARLRAALEEIADGGDSCNRCEGEGSLWADGKAHYAYHTGATVACPNCGGLGRLIEDAEKIAKQALEKGGE